MITHPTFFLSPPSAETRRFLRFLVVGVSGTLLDFSLLILLKLAGLPTLAANSLSFLAGVANNYTWNRRWTFADRPSAGWLAQFVRFTLISLAGLALNNLIVLALEAPLGALFGQPQWGYLPAKALATGIVLFWNFFANRRWTFSEVTS